MPLATKSTRTTLLSWMAFPARTLRAWSSKRWRYQDIACRQPRIELEARNNKLTRSGGIQRVRKCVGGRKAAQARKPVFGWTSCITSDVIMPSLFEIEPGLYHRQMGLVMPLHPAILTDAFHHAT